MFSENKYMKVYFEELLPLSFGPEDLVIEKEA